MSLSILCAAANVASANGRACEAKVGGPGCSVSLSSDRATLLRSTMQRLARAGLPGYAAVYKGKGVQGATLVATVERSSISAWFKAVGKDSIGIATSVLPNVNKGSGYIRLGERLYYFHAVRGGENHSNGTPCVPVDMREKDGGLTEATFFVSPAEMRAMRAFYEARYLNLIKDQGGQPIHPPYKMIGASGTFASEGCALACTSAFNELWLGAFESNLAGIRAYGQAHGNADMAAASPEMIGLLRGIGERTAGVQSGRKALVRANFPKTPLVTVFNGGFGPNPQQTLTWRGGHWNGLTEPRVLFDRAPAEKPTATFKGERVSLQDFARQLGQE